MQCRAGICRQPDDIAGIRRDLWCEQDNMKHQTATTRDYGEDGSAYALTDHSASSSRSRPAGNSDRGKRRCAAKCGTRKSVRHWAAPCLRCTSKRLVLWYSQEQFWLISFRLNQCCWRGPGCCCNMGPRFVPSKLHGCLFRRMTRHSMVC